MLYVVWYFVGGCMVLFAAIILWAWFRCRKGDSTLLPIIGLIGGLYVATGLGGFVYRHHDPFMLMFLVQGSLLVVSSIGVAPCAQGGRLNQMQPRLRQLQAFRRRTAA